MKIDNVRVMGFGDAIRAAKFPMAVDVDAVNYELTKGIQSLAEAPIGSGHDNWLNGVIVQFDLTASLKFWPQLQRYHFIDFVSSQSTMHRIAQFNIDESCNSYVEPEIINILKRLVDKYNQNPSDDGYLKILYNIPSGFEITARMTTNYRQLKTIYNQRKAHRLPEWREFCKWIEKLPNSELITREAT